MELNKLMEIANDVYPDGLIGQYWNNGNGMPDVVELGDGLARFVAMEIAETFDPDLKSSEQLEEAANCVGRAASELESVAEALHAARITKVEDSNTELEK